MKLTKSILVMALCASSFGAFAHSGSYGVEPHTQSFLQALEGGQPIETMTPTEARAVLTGAQKGAALAPASVKSYTINVDGQKIAIKVVRPLEAEGKLPAFMFFHGGGWVLGDFPTHERLIRDLVVRSGTAAVYVDYTPSPEAKYPVAINQAYEATKWVAEHGDQINIDGSRLAVAGNSVGGNMAAVVALKAKEAGTPKLRFQLLLWPVTNASFQTSSYDQFSNGHFLTRGMMKWFWDNYTTSPVERNEIYASPLRASLEQLSGLPDTLIQTAEKDVLRDEGEAYGIKLQQAGVNVTSVRYNGMIHDFGMLNALSTIPEVQDSLTQAAQALANHLTN
ncbi:alpha/beta hydrolase [Agarivorans sp. QJM3NY_25]|uniref:alpha/beta hydrolase n=1 Tax=Agarivorans sp. QJM3NY_25 TaxID=3421430 RepID=UPI003D7E38C7